EPRLAQGCGSLLPEKKRPGLAHRKHRRWWRTVNRIEAPSRASHPKDRSWIDPTAPHRRAGRHSRSPPPSASKLKAGATQVKAEGRRPERNGAVPMHGVLTRKVQNNASAVIRAHLIGSNTCTAPEIGVTSVSDTPILDLCRLLVARGHDPSTPMEVWRGT